MRFHKCPHEQTPRSCRCHGQVTSKSTVPVDPTWFGVAGFVRRKALPPAAQPAPRRWHARFCSCPSLPCQIVKKLLLLMTSFVSSTTPSVDTVYARPSRPNELGTPIKSSRPLVSNVERHSERGKRARPLSSQHTNVNAGPCTFSRCDRWRMEVVKLRGDHQSVVLKVLRKRSRLTNDACPPSCLTAVYQKRHVQCWLSQHSLEQLLPTTRNLHKEMCLWAASR